MYFSFILLFITVCSLVFDVLIKHFLYFLHLYLHSVSKILYYLYWRYVNSFPSTLPVSSSLVWSLQPLFASFSLWSLFPNPSCLDSPQFQLYALCLADLCSLLKTCFPEPHFRTGVDKKISFFFFFLVCVVY